MISLNIRPCSALFFLSALFTLFICHAKSEVATLSDSVVQLKWQQGEKGWQLVNADVLAEDGTLVSVGSSSGRYTILYSESEPDKTPVPLTLRGDAFPESIYRYPISHWNKAIIPAALNLIGEEFSFFPSKAERTPEGAWQFEQETEAASVSARWALDRSFPGDVLVTMTIIARKSGWFSIATPTLASMREDTLKWAVVPGYFKGNKTNPELVLSLAYGHGLPARPVIMNEGAASTLASIMTNQSGITLSVVAEPGVVDPYPADSPARERWRIGLSHMNRQSELSPTLYRPLLGGEGSRLKEGESLSFSFRYSLRQDDWFAAIRHAAYDIYRLEDFLKLKKPVRSLSQRLHSIHKYVTDDATSLWHTEEFGGLTIGAQAYNGGVVGANRDKSNPKDYDAMKNSDYGAMWMLARLTKDPRLTKDRLPYARNFKFVQQQAEPGFFQGAAIGQYYLAKSRRFAEEWGDYVEPVAITFYTMLDLGNILLFEPDDKELRERLRLGAERLMSWQKPDGSWAVAYDHATQKELFTELPDARSTSYGLLVAYRILGDRKYLDGARKGADWLIKNSVEPARFLGVCGDARFGPDFATVQMSQAFLDLFEATGEERYRKAAIETARQYVTDVFTHPLASNKEKRLKGLNQLNRLEVGKHDDDKEKKARGLEVADWQLNQTGLAFEHGGTIGTASGSGPILLSSYAGLYVRMAEITGEPLFRDLARAAALARDSFLNPQTQVASYYWLGMNRGPGPFPHHAWWQFGWITDYLVSEVQLRSAGAISFPRGFVTPKVGPHGCFGFAPGRLYGASVNLAWGTVDTGMPEVDYLVCRSTDEQKTFVILINNSPRMVRTQVKAPPSAFVGLKTKGWKSASILNASGEGMVLPNANASWTVEIASYGISVLMLE